MFSPHRISPHTGKFVGFATVETHNGPGYMQSSFGGGPCVPGPSVTTDDLVMVTNVVGTNTYPVKEVVIG